jgi:Na+/glutamate symporter
MRYSGLAAQFLVSIGLCVFIGMKVDKWIRLSMPLFVWMLPLLIIMGIIIKITRDTSKKK